MITMLNGYRSCTREYKKPIEDCVLALAKHFIGKVNADRGTHGERYRIYKCGFNYLWACDFNGAEISLEVLVMRDKDKTWYVTLDFGCKPGLPSMFLVIYTLDTLTSTLKSEIMHKGYAPENAIIQGVCGRLVETDIELDYKDLDYV